VIDQDLVDKLRKNDVAVWIIYDDEVLSIMSVLNRWLQSRKRKMIESETYENEMKKKK
jgi:hypothetical protein